MTYLLTTVLTVGSCYKGNPRYFENVIIKVLEVNKEGFKYCHMPKCNGYGTAQLAHIEMYKKVRCK